MRAAEVPQYRIPEPIISPGALVTLWEAKHKKNSNTPRIPGVNIVNNPWGEPPLPPIGKPPKPDAHSGTPKKRHSGDKRWTSREPRSSRHGRN